MKKKKDDRQLTLSCFVFRALFPARKAGVLPPLETNPLRSLVDLPLKLYGDDDVANPPSSFIFLTLVEWFNPIHGFVPDAQNHDF